MERVIQIAAQWGRASTAELKAAGAKVCIAGRVASVRTHGGRLSFADIVSDGAALQAVLPGGLGAGVRRADIVSIVGRLERTPAGVLSVRAESVSLLRRPHENAVPDREVEGVLAGPRCRDRHLQMLTDSSIGAALRKRATIVQSLRKRLDGLGFVEVETPIFGARTGAAAGAFALESNPGQVLRIAPELRLKQLVVGGMEAVYELGRVFRDEGGDSTHECEFTMLEAYRAYWGLADAMAFVEESIKEAAEVVGAVHISSAPFERVDVTDALASTGIDLLPLLENDVSAREKLMDALAVHGYSPSRLDAMDVPQMIDRLIGERIERSLERPTFLAGHPVAISPLATADPKRPLTALRAELFVRGIEIANMYDELGDANEQRARLAVTGHVLAPADVDYVHVLRAGLPPCAGLGIGIDRLAMAIMDTPHIRNVLSFPH